MCANYIDLPKNVNSFSIRDRENWCVAWVMPCPRDLVKGCGLCGVRWAALPEITVLFPPLPLPTGSGCCQPLQRQVKTENHFEAHSSSSFKASFACVNMQVSWFGERTVGAGAGLLSAFVGSACSLGSG